MKTVILGVFYQRLDGSLVLTYGNFNGVVLFRNADHSGGTATHDEVATWKLARGLRDFPNADDPLLPYEFDLWHDTRTLSQLINEFDGIDNCLACPDLMALCKEYNIDLRDPQTIRNYNEEYARNYGNDGR